MSRVGLQVVNAFVGVATIALAAMTLAFGSESPVYGTAAIPPLPALDSNLRFFGGLALGLGLLLLWMTPSIERHTKLFRAVWLCAFVGGLGRLISWNVVGAPPAPMMVFTVIEVPLVPVLIAWQAAVASRSEAARNTTR
jgi:hypothetical protein